MKRADFITLYADIVAAGRRRNFPDMRLSEEAVSRMDDEKSAAKLWKKHSEAFKLLSKEDTRQVLTSGEKQ